MIVYKNRTKRFIYFIAHFERVMEVGREMEDICAIHTDRVERYENKWEDTST